MTRTDAVPGCRIEALASDPQHVSVLAGIIAGRQGWLAASLAAWRPAARLGWSAEELAQSRAGCLAETFP